MIVHFFFVFFHLLFISVLCAFHFNFVEIPIAYLFGSFCQSIIVCSVFLFFLSCPKPFWFNYVINQKGNWFYWIFIIITHFVLIGKLWTLVCVYTHDQSVQVIKEEKKEKTIYLNGILPHLITWTIKTKWTNKQTNKTRVKWSNSNLILEKMKKQLRMRHYIKREDRLHLLHVTYHFNECRFKNRDSAIV